MKDPNIFYIDNLLDHCRQNQAEVLAPNGSSVWVPARPIGFSGIRYRIKAAWLVLTGHADAVLWRGQ